jgi:acetate kinase
MPTPKSNVLALNGGSSSLKFGIFEQLASADEVQHLYRGTLSGVGRQHAHLQVQAGSSQFIIDQPCECSTQDGAIRIVVETISRLNLSPPSAIGHRIVHGGPSLREHQRITADVLQKLQSAAPFAPLHVPPALHLIRQTESHYPGVPQFACFDTAFHRSIPEVAARLPLPDEFWSNGIRRYGFHGLSCESIVHALGTALPARVVIAHLGNGASITAVAGGQSLDTTMGLTPTGGIVMGTRTGDLDPGAILYLLRTSATTPDQLEQLLDKQSGLLGISGISADMRELHQSSDPRAKIAVDMFARSAQKAIAGLVAVLGGLDLLVFSGGIGEHDSDVRAKICDHLRFIGVILDSAANSENLRGIGDASQSIPVLIVPSDEEAQIARHVFRLSRNTDQPPDHGATPR